MDVSQAKPSLAPVAAALVVGGIAAIFDSTIVTIGLHTLQTELGTTVAGVQWVSTAYLLALAVAIPFVAWGQARFGGKRLWLAALTLFLVGSILCSLAWSLPSLVAFRAIQGLGGGLILPLMQTLLIQASAGRDLGKLMAAVALPIALGPILGPVIGGVILNWLNWHWMFWVNVPICLVGIVLAVRYLDPARPAVPAPKFDILGFLMLAPSFAVLLYALSNTHAEGGFARPDVWLPAVIGLVLLVAFAFYAARRGDSALVDVRLLATPAFARVTAVMFFIGIGLFGVMVLLPLLWQAGYGLDVLTAGLYLIPQGVGSLVSRSLAIKLSERLGAKWVAVGGFLLMALATAPFAMVSFAATSPWVLMAVLFVRGLGLGAVLIPVMSVAYAGLRADDVPHATIITRISQQLGGAFGTAVLAVVLQASLNGAHSATDIAAGFHTAFWWGTALTVVALALSLFLPDSKLSEVLADEREAAPSAA